MGRLNPFSRASGLTESTQRTWLQRSFAMSVISSLHRRAGVILFVQIIIWTISGFYFSWQGREALTANQYYHTLPAAPLAGMSNYATPDIHLARLGDVRSVSITLIDGIPRLEAEYVPALERGHETLSLIHI